MRDVSPTNGRGVGAGGRREDDKFSTKKTDEDEFTSYEPLRYSRVRQGGLRVTAPKGLYNGSFYARDHKTLNMKSESELSGKEGKRWKECCTRLLECDIYVLDLPTPEHP